VAPPATAERLLAEGGFDLLGGHRQERAEVAHLGLVRGHRLALCGRIGRLMATGPFSRKDLRRGLADIGF
jgi:hypothetical protein